MPLTRFQGNCPNNVNRDAKYGIHFEKGQPIIGLTYSAAGGERWYASTKQHPRLVEMVNAIKVETTGKPGGAFYINEYGHVIVPTVDNAAPSTPYYLAGTYSDLLEFEFEGNLLSPEPVGLDGKPLEIGKEWQGPRVGIPYVLAAGGSDIKYTLEVRPNVEKTVKLSEKVGVGAANATAAKLRTLRGFTGGRFYINERRCLFTPVAAQGSTSSFVYAGQLGANDAWFPNPHALRT